MRKHVLLSGLLSGMLLLSMGCQPKVHPEAARLLVEAEAAFEQGAFNIARVYTDSSEALAPDLPAVQFMKGRIFTELGRLDIAEAAYKKTLALDPEHPGAWLNLGNTAYRQQNLRVAIDRYLEEESRHPSALVYLQLGRAYADLGEADSARWAFAESLGLDSSRATVHMRFGQLLQREGEVDAAVRSFRKGVALDPGNLNYQYTLAAALTAANQLEEASTLLRAFTEQHPWHYWSHYMLGQTLGRMGNADEAALYEEKALALQPILDEVQHWETLAESNPRHFMLWVRLSYTYRRIGNTQDADRADKLVASLAPDYLIHKFEDPRIYQDHLIAVEKLTRGEMEAAIEGYKALLRQQPEHPELWLNLGVAYAAYGRIVQAQQCWEAAKKYEPRLVRANQYIEDLNMAFYNPEAPGNGAG